MFIASRRIGLLDRYRIPYLVDPAIANSGVRIIRADGSGAELLSFAGTRVAEQPTFLDGAFLHAALVDQHHFGEHLAVAGKDWAELEPIVDRRGVPHATIRSAPDGSVALPFDIDEPLDALLCERYLPRGRSTRTRELAKRGYYNMRPLLPYSAQMAIRRGFTRLQERAVFPAWPVETSLHRLEALMLSLLEQVADEPLPWLSNWPAPYTWAIVLTHDIERKAGYRNVAKVLAIEERHGLRAAWYFVPERDYSVEDSVLDELRASGGEVCLHGLRHDGRDLSPGTFQERLPAMRSYLERWGARGFRGPATHRDQQFVQELGIDHDSSWSDVARYEPQPGGTCSWLPFFIGEVVELPITLPMDHTLFELQRVRRTDAWFEKAAVIREHEGMALMVTHPDYLIGESNLRLYEDFLVVQAADDTAWRALPREVASWWRRRADSSIERRNGGWSVVGPAATDARVRVGAPVAPPASLVSSGAADA